MKTVLRRYITEELLNDSGELVLDDGDNLLGTGLLDSVAMISLVLFIETEFSIPVPPEDVTIENFLSIDTIASYLTKRTVGAS